MQYFSFIGGGECDDVGGSEGENGQWGDWTRRRGMDKGLEVVDVMVEAVMDMVPVLEMMVEMVMEVDK